MPVQMDKIVEEPRSEIIRVAPPASAPVNSPTLNKCESNGAHCVDAQQFVQYGLADLRATHHTASTSRCRTGRQLS